MEQREIIKLMENIIADRGVPKNIKTTLEESLLLLNSTEPQEEKIASLISVLDDASSNPNLPMNARTHIWSIVSALESGTSKK